MIRKEDLFQAGRFSKPHGVKGELTLLTDFPVPEQINSPYLICDMDGILVPFFTESYRPKGNASVLVKLENVDDETTARRFAGRAVYYPRSAQVGGSATENDNWQQRTGYVLESQDGDELGVITGVDNETVNTLLHVDRHGKKLLIPAVDEWIISVDRTEKRITMSLPEGLTDLQ
ncbi:MAG: ribosome maturation factor RimM [Tannerella sp.]|jgi:16S rRNA processing protein RimM|nr:ribosome maturation factor RimM [Tannerella sp.]